jgi:hypothetical protein
MSNPVFDSAREQLFDVQFCDNSYTEAIDAKQEVYEIIADLEKHHEATTEAFRAELASVKAERDALKQVLESLPALISPDRRGGVSGYELREAMKIITDTLKRVTP